MPSPEGGPERALLDTLSWVICGSCGGAPVAFSLCVDWNRFTVKDNKMYWMFRIKDMMLEMCLTMKNKEKISCKYENKRSFK